MDERLFSVLRAHNPWLSEPEAQERLLRAGLPSPYVQRSRSLSLEPGRVALVVGPRQSGKSTWVRHELANAGAPVLVLHGEEPRVRELASSAGEMLDALSEVLTGDTVLAFEEVQRLPDAALLLKGVVDLQPRRRVVATGSSSLQLRSRTRESLAGRARRTLLLPFALREVSAGLGDDLVPAAREVKMRAAWERLVLFGGYPEAWLSDSPAERLYHLVEAIALRDTSDLFRIDRPAALRRLLSLAAADIGNLVNLSHWAEVAGVSRPTVERYLGVVEDVHLLRLVRPFAGGRRAEITGTPKVFLVDNGLRNALFGGFVPLDNRADRGSLFENAVFGELSKSLRLLDELMFWHSKGGAEVDFVVRRGSQLVAIEVKAGDLRAPRISRSLRSFVKAYEPASVGVINAALSADEVVSGVPVLFRRPWELGEVLERLE